MCVELKSLPLVFYPGVLSLWLRTPRIFCRSRAKVIAYPRKSRWVRQTESCSESSNSTPTFLPRGAITFYPSTSRIIWVQHDWQYFPRVREDCPGTQETKVTQNPEILPQNFHLRCYDFSPEVRRKIDLHSKFLDQYHLYKSLIKICPSIMITWKTVSTLELRLVSNWAQNPRKHFVRYRRCRNGWCKSIQNHVNILYKLYFVREKSWTG